MNTFPTKKKSCKQLKTKKTINSHSIEDEERTFNSKDVEDEDYNEQDDNINQNDSRPK